MKFYFKLQPLLNRERFLENDCVVRLKVVRDAYQKERQKSEYLRQRKAMYQRELKAKTQSGVTSGELRTYEEYFKTFSSIIDTHNLKLQEISNELYTKQEELLAIVKKRKALEKLRDRWKEEHRNHLTLLSNKEMDEIAMTKYINKFMVECDEG